MKTNSLYKLYLVKGKTNPQGSIVGEYKKKDNPNFICEIVLCDNEVRKAGCFDIVTTVYPSKSIMYITQDMLDNLQINAKNELFELYHELGHLHCGHYDNTESSESSEYNEEKLLNEECEADSFAAEILGKEIVHEALQDYLKLRAQADKLFNINGTAQSVKNIRNLRSRIASLNK